MSTSAHVQSIQALDELKGALGRFRGEAQEVLNAAEQEIRRTLDWLQERLNHWQNEVRRRQEEVRRAAAALARCRASGYVDRDGRYHAPDCSAYEHALHQAELRLHEAEAELANVRRWLAQVQQAVGDYQVQARRLAAQLGNELPKADAFLGRKVATLQSYVSIGIPSGGAVPLLGDPFAAPALSGSAVQAFFREAMAGLSSGERGAWGEHAVLNEARGHGHRILLEHGGVATTRGYDCVSWDGRTLHIWEAKNYSATEAGSTSVVRELSALDPEKRLANVAQFLRDLSVDDPDRPAILKAIQEDQVQWHIRLGPDTDLSLTPLESLGWGNVEARQYSYEELLRLAAPPIPSGAPEPGG
jgi:hypothetical protein